MELFVLQYVPRRVGVPVGGQKNENRPDRAAHGERAAAALRRHRADRLLPHRGAGPPGPRRDAVRERRFGARPAPAGAAASPMALRLDAKSATRSPTTCSCSTGSASCADEFDILHFHIDLFHFPLFRPIADRTVTTLHGRLDLPDLQPLYGGFRDMPLVSISDAQRAADADGQLARHGPSRPAAPICSAARPSPRRLSRLPRPHLAGEAARPRDRDRRARRACR